LPASTSVEAGMPIGTSTTRFSTSPLSLTRTTSALVGPERHELDVLERPVDHRAR
jgi:hypothetical protein